MNPLRVLVVDDEPIARKVLRQELACLDLVEVVGEADNGQAALSDIHALRPDLIFLDIQMPAMNGFELLNRLEGGHLPIVIMVTAFDQYAIGAFEAGAIDYVLKPVSQERLRIAVERALLLHRRPKQIADNLAEVQRLGPAVAPVQRRGKKIVGRSGSEYFLLNPEEIFAFHASGDIVTILTGQQRYLATQNLRSLQETLGSGPFCRIHRNALVNIDQIRKISKITGQRWLLTLNNGQEFVVSKRQAREVRKALHW